MPSFRAPKQENPLIKVTPVRDERAYNAALASMRLPDKGEARAREVASKFGIDENLSPHERAMKIIRAFHKRGGVGGGYRARSRVPGEDDE